MLFELLTKKSLNVTKNKNKAELIKIVLTRKLILRFLTIKADNENEIIKNIIKGILFFKSDLIQLSFGPMAIANKKGIKKGIINLL